MKLPRTMKAKAWIDYSDYLMQLGETNQANLIRLYVKKYHYHAKFKKRELDLYSGIMKLAIAGELINGEFVYKHPEYDKILSALPYRFLQDSD